MNSEITDKLPLIECTPNSVDAQSIQYLQSKYPCPIDISSSYPMTWFTNGGTQNSFDTPMNMDVTANLPLWSSPGGLCGKQLIEYVWDSILPSP